jgi:AcrR family transcriptional regulator
MTADRGQANVAGRMKAEDRAASIVLEADLQINERRSARISPVDLAASLGTSRSLVYSYFPDTDRLIGAVLNRHASLLAEAGLKEALAKETLELALLESAAIYCDHIIDHGAAIELCMREPRFALKVEGAMRSLALASLHRLGRLAMKELSYGAAEALAVVRILQIMPEDAARLVRAGSVSRGAAHSVCRRLLAAAVDELRPAAVN